MLREKIRYKTSFDKKNVYKNPTWSIFKFGDSNLLNMLQNKIISVCV
jgi:hypothetical protein